MELNKMSRMSKCGGADECEDKAVYNIRFAKKRIALCKNCMKELRKIILQSTVPHCVKNRFNTDNRE